MLNVLMVALGRAGSNAYIEQKRKKCGLRERKKKETQKAAYRAEECPHDITDKHGSSKTMSRVFCLRCHKRLLVRGRQLQER